MSFAELEITLRNRNNGGGKKTVLTLSCNVVEKDPLTRKDSTFSIKPTNFCFEHCPFREHATRQQNVTAPSLIKMTTLLHWHPLEISVPEFKSRFIYKQSPSHYGLTNNRIM
jgi:hypothetical protein